MTYTAKNIANFVVSYCANLDLPISNLKLQKILYFLWIEYFKRTGQELYIDDICAWRLGPVVPEVYYEFCSYAGTPIVIKPPYNIVESDAALLNSIVQRFLPLSASTLVDMTHAKGKPWDMIYQDGVGNRAVIPFSLIKDLECTTNAH